MYICAQYKSKINKQTNKQNQKIMKGIIISLVALVVLAGTLFLTYVGKNDHEIELRQLAFAQNDVCINFYDNMTKTILQVAQVPKQFQKQAEENFKNIYPDLISGRYKDSDGSLQPVMMKWITESNPQFDLNAFTKLYEKIQVVVEAKRNEFTTQQNKLRDIERQHTIFCSTFFNKNLFGMGDRIIPRCKDGVDVTAGNNECIRYINSKNTSDAYQTGEENDIDLFK